MQILLVTIVIAVFSCILVLNFYFRVKVLKAYKILVKNRIEFNSTDIFNRKKMNAVIERYPRHKQEILDFTQNIQKSVRIASVLIFLVTAFTAIFMFVKK